MTAYNSDITSTNTSSKRGSSIPRVISDVVDFSATTNAAGDTLGDSVDPDQYVAAVAQTALGQKVTLDANYAYSAADALRLTTATGAVNCKVRVWACVISLDDGGTLSDSDAQTSTFA